MRLHAVTPALLVLCLWPVAPSVAGNGYDAARIASLVKAGQIEKAFAEAGEWVAATPDSREALEICGGLAIRCGAYEDAADCYEAALFYAETSEAAVGLGDALLELGRRDAALQSYRHALDINDREFLAHVGIGRVFMVGPDEQLEARVSLGAALGIAPDNPAALTALAELDLSEGLADRAWETLTEVTRAAPEMAPARLLAGKTLAQRGQLTTARQHWREYIRLEPARPESWLLEHNLFPIGQRELGVSGSFFRFSPDGKRIAHAGAGATARQQIIVIPSASPQSPTVVCTVQERLIGLAWSPDGSRLALRSYKKVTEGGKDRWDYSIWTAPSTGGGLRSIHTGRYVGVPAWMPDGKRLCFDGQIARRGRGMLVADDEPDATPDTLIEPPRGHSVQWAFPDNKGDAMIATSVSYGDARAWNLLLYDMSKRSAPLTIYSTENPLYYPVFTPDNAAIIFLERDGERTYSLYALPVSGERERPRIMLRGAYYASPPSMTPDGRQLLVYVRGGAAIVSLAGLRE